MRNKIQSFKIVVFIFFAIFFLTTCYPSDISIQEEKGKPFSFAFLTDIHIQPENNAVKGFKKAIKKVNSLKPEFVIAGGDLVMDAFEVPLKRANLLYDLYLENCREFKMQVFNTIGNHEILGWDKKSGIPADHQFYGKKLYEKKIGKRYYSFDYKGWHLIILDSVAKSEKTGYRGEVSKKQIKWLTKDLANTSKETPIIISIHIPLISALPLLRYGTDKIPGGVNVVINSKDVLDLFKAHNLKLVLQGHHHYSEEIKIGGITFISVPAVCGRKWTGPNRGIEEGFGLIHINGNNFKYEYIDYGWEIENANH